MDWQKVNVLRKWPNRSGLKWKKCWSFQGKGLVGGQVLNSDGMGRACDEVETDERKPKVTGKRERPEMKLSVRERRLQKLLQLLDRVAKRASTSDAGMWSDDKWRAQSPSVAVLLPHLQAVSVFECINRHPNALVVCASYEYFNQTHSLRFGLAVARSFLSSFCSPKSTRTFESRAKVTLSNIFESQCSKRCKRATLGQIKVRVVDRNASYSLEFVLFQCLCRCLRSLDIDKFAVRTLRQHDLMADLGGKCEKQTRCTKDIESKPQSVNRQDTGADTQRPNASNAWQKERKGGKRPSSSNKRWRKGTSKHVQRERKRKTNQIDTIDRCFKIWLAQRGRNICTIRSKHRENVKTANTRVAAVWRDKKRSSYSNSTDKKLAN